MNISSGLIKSLDTLLKEWLVMANVLQLQVNFLSENNHDGEYLRAL